MAGIDRQCPACGGHGRSHSLVVEGVWRLVICRSCRSQYFRVDPALGAPSHGQDSEYWEDYKFAVYADPGVEQAFADRYARMLQRADECCGPLRSVLDVGCGIGNFLDFAQAQGLQAVGSDVEPTAVAHARERGLTACLAAELADQVAARSLDAMSMWDVIEHLTSPAEVVREALTRVRSGGAVLLETPDAMFPARAAVLATHRATGGRVNVTSPMYYLEHKIYFSERGLRDLLGKAGADVVHVERLNSPREKMSMIFEHKAEAGSGLSRILQRTWPALEAGSSRLGLGNKLMVVARVR